MSHEMFNLAKASSAQLNVAMGVIVIGGAVLALLLCLLMAWSRRKEAARGKKRRPRGASLGSEKRRSGQPQRL